MEFSEDFIKDSGLTPEQVTSLTSYFKTEYDKGLGEEVHTHVENSLGKVASGIEKITGIKREQGQKMADYLTNASSLYFEGTKSSLERQKADLEAKLKDFKGDAELKSQLEAVKADLSKYKERAAKADEWEGYKEKYEATSEKLTATEQRIAFRDAIPSKPEKVNAYEWKAKVGEFQKELLSKNNLVFDENDTAWLVDKENEFKRVKLEEAVKQSTVINDLLKDSKKGGFGGATKTVKIKDLPFELPENATSKQRNDAIRDYLRGIGITPDHGNYSTKFAELNQTALGLK